MVITNRVFTTNETNSLGTANTHKEQVVGAVTTVEQWNHTKMPYTTKEMYIENQLWKSGDLRCGFIERLLPLCNSYQLDMLWTVLQPSLHRDYFYAVKLRYPNYHFRRISTPHSRTLKGYNHRSLDGEDSFYLSNVNDLGEFRDDDGLPRLSQSVFTHYSEDKLSSSLKQSTVVQSIGKNRVAHQSVNINIPYVGKKRIPSRFTSKTTRSVTTQWMNQSVGSFSTTSNQICSEDLLHWFTHSWSESEQNDFLRRLIIKFDERQQYFISCVIMQRRYRDFISLLPVKVACQILSYLTLPELSRSRRVCKHWKSIIDRERDLWKPKMKFTSAEHTSTQTDWETFQKQRLAIKRNWITGTGHLIQCAGHTERVLCVCGNLTHLATGSLDRTIKIWLFNDGTLCQTLIGHTKGVWSVRFLSSAILISGAYDATIKIWNINTSICLRTLLSHTGPVWSLACSDLFCLSGSQDRTARLWLLPKCELHATLTGHRSSIFGVDLNQEQNLCATSSADKTVRIWSLTSHRCVKVLHATTDDYVMSVSLQHGFIAYAFGGHILVYRVNVTDIRSCTVQKIMETQEHRDRIEGVQLILLNDEEKQPSLVSTGQDGLIKYWDLNKIASQHTYNVQNEDVVKINCIHADRTHIVTVGDDCLVKILDFATRTPEN